MLSPRTYSTTVLTCGWCKCCSATATCRPPRSTLMSLERACKTCTPNTTRAADTIPEIEMLTCGEGVYPRWVAKQPQKLLLGLTNDTGSIGLRLLRSRTGVNPLATMSIANRASCFLLHHPHSATPALCGRLCRFARWAFMTRCFGTGVLIVPFVRLQEFSCV